MVLCEDVNDKCQKYANDCETDSYVKEHCPKTCGCCGKSYLHCYRLKSFGNMNDTYYLISDDLTTVKTTPPNVLCEDANDKCPKYANDCETDSYVKEHCPKTCGRCGKSYLYCYGLK